MANKTAIEILSLKNPSFCAYMICASLLALKMICLAFFTGYKRKIHKTWASPEDLKTNQGQLEPNAEVERVRRAHLNDLENIPMFWIVGLIYLFVKPPVGLACFLFFTYAAVRIAHTVIYAVRPVPQPTRAILFSSGALITIYMAFHAMIIGFCHI